VSNSGQDFSLTNVPNFLRKESMLHIIGVSFILPGYTPEALMLVY